MTIRSNYRLSYEYVLFDVFDFILNIILFFISLCMVYAYSIDKCTKLYHILQYVSNSFVHIV